MGAGPSSKRETVAAVAPLQGVAAEAPAPAPVKEQASFWSDLKPVSEAEDETKGEAVDLLVAGEKAEAVRGAEAPLVAALVAVVTPPPTPPTSPLSSVARTVTSVELEPARRTVPAHRAHRQVKSTTRAMRPVGSPLVASSTPVRAMSLTATRAKRTSANQSSTSSAKRSPLAPSPVSSSRRLGFSLRRAKRDDDSGGLGPEPELVVDRYIDDAGMRRHLISQATPKMVENAIFAATKMLSLAQRARKELERKRVLKEEAVAGPPLTNGEPREKMFVNTAKTLPTALARKPSKLTEGIRLLEQRADFIGIKRITMAGDGNCQFRGLAHELYGDQEHHGWVRRRVMNRLRDHAEEYAAFVGEARDWADYLDRMAQPRTWGDELTLRAAAEEYGCVIHVVTTEEENWLLCYYPERLAAPMAKPGKVPPFGVRECFLCYVAPIHYDVVALKPRKPRKTKKAHPASDAPSSASSPPPTRGPRISWSRPTELLDDDAATMASIQHLIG